MAERIVHGEANGLLTMARAALPVLPGANLLPGVAKKGGDLPDLVLTRLGVQVDPARVSAYSEVCGFAPSQTLPFTYPHMLAFPLQMQIMTDASFPYPAIGTVHLRNSITSHRTLDPRELLDVSVTAQNLRAHPKGTMFDLDTTITAEGAPAWESTSTYLRVGGSNPEAQPEGEPFEVVPGTGPVWRLSGDLGRRYAAVSGDHNPIHLYPLTAKALGFRRQIAHGMWSKARCVAAMANRIGDAANVEVEFKKPIFLPGKVAFGSRRVAAGIDFSLTDPVKGSPHLVGRLR